MRWMGGEGYEVLREQGTESTLSVFKIFKQFFIAEQTQLTKSPPIPSQNSFTQFFTLQIKQMIQIILKTLSKSTQKSTVFTKKIN